MSSWVAYGTVVPSGWVGGKARDPEGSADVTVFGESGGTASSDNRYGPGFSREPLRFSEAWRAHLVSQPRERPRVSPENRYVIRSLGGPSHARPPPARDDRLIRCRRKRERIRARERERLLILGVDLTLLVPAAARSRARDDTQSCLCLYGLPTRDSRLAPCRR
jgi:hypothetical protein